MNPAAQSWLQVAVLLVGIGATLVAAIAYQTHYIDKRIDDLRAYVDGRFQAVDERFDGLLRYLEARFKALEDRLERLEHPVTRP